MSHFKQRDDDRWPTVTDYVVFAVLVIILIWGIALGLNA